MANIIASPTRYIQGKGEMEHLCQHASLIGQKLFVIITESGKKRVEDAITKSAQAQGTSVTYEFFNGECSICLLYTSRAPADNLLDLEYGTNYSTFI